MKRVATYDSQVSSVPYAYSHQICFVYESSVMHLLYMYTTKHIVSVCLLCKCMVHWCLLQPP